MTASNRNELLQKGYLLLEFALLYVGLPFAVNYSMSSMRILFMLVLLISAKLCLCLLLRDRTFDRTQFWNMPGLSRDMKRILVLYLAVFAMLAGGVWFFDRASFFNLPLKSPKLWALIIIAYPLISVYPQEIIYRAFFFHRYASIMPTPAARILVSAMVFALVHFLFGNLTVILLTLGGGLLFGYTYHRTRSLAAVSFEHMLYGWCLFTVGLGDKLLFATRLVVERVLGS